MDERQTKELTLKITYSCLVIHLTSRCQDTAKSKEDNPSVTSKHSMGTEAPDPKTFASWEDAFQYPIPVVRGMEKQLRRDIASNREKLRTLVG